MYPSKANFTPLFAVRGDGCSDGVNTNTGITRITGITRNIVNYRLQHIQRESFPRSNNDATVHQVLQYYTSGLPLDSTWISKNRNHANIQEESHVKWIKIRMMHAPNPPSTPQWTGKQSLLSWLPTIVFPVCRHFAPKFEKAKFTYIHTYMKFIKRCIIEDGSNQRRDKRDI